MKAIVTILLLSCSIMIFRATAQNLDVEGNANITEMDKSQ